MSSNNNNVAIEDEKAVNPPKEKNQPNRKWTPEHLAYAIGLLDQNKTLKEAIDATIERFNVQPVSQQYLSKMYKKARAADRRPATSEPLDPMMEYPQLATPKNWWTSKNTFIDRLAYLVDEAAKTIDVERSARSGEPVKTKRYYGEAAECAKLLGQAAGFLKKEDGRVLPEPTETLEEKLKRVTFAELVAEYLPFACNQAKQIITIETINEWNETASRTLIEAGKTDKTESSKKEE